MGTSIKRPLPAIAKKKASTCSRSSSDRTTSSRTKLKPTTSSLASPNSIIISTTAQRNLRSIKGISATSKISLKSLCSCRSTLINTFGGESSRFPGDNPLGTVHGHSRTKEPSRLLISNGLYKPRRYLNDFFSQHHHGFTAGGSFDGLGPFSNQKKGKMWGRDITSTQSNYLGIRANRLKTFFRTRQKWFLKKRHRNHRQ